MRMMMMNILKGARLGSHYYQNSRLSFIAEDGDEDDRWIKRCNLERSKTVLET